MFEWKDKVCIITGACSGIGWSFVQSVVKRGSKCLMADLNFKAGEQKEKELREKYGQDKVIYFRVDVSSQQNFEAAFEKCVQFFGKHPGLELELSGEKFTWLMQYCIVFYSLVAFKQDQFRTKRTVDP